MKTNFSKNLRSLCAEHGSIAKVCRDIGINRQQFNRYLNGAGMPAAHNLRRISRHFGLSESDLLSEHNIFNRLHIQKSTTKARNPADILTDVFRDQAKYLRRYLGFYHGHFCTPSWPGTIMRTLIWLKEQDGYVVTHTFERASAPDNSIRHRVRYSGLATYRGNRIYLFENAFSDDGFLSESVLFPAHRQQVKYLRGMTMGVAVRPRLSPYSSPVIWRRIRESVSAREALRVCEALPTNSLRIEPTIRKFLSSPKSREENLTTSGDVL